MSSPAPDVASTTGPTSLRALILPEYQRLTALTPPPDATHALPIIITYLTSTHGVVLTQHERDVASQIMQEMEHAMSGTDIMVNKTKETETGTVSLRALLLPDLMHLTSLARASPLSPTRDVLLHLSSAHGVTLTPAQRDVLPMFMDDMVYRGAEAEDIMVSKTTQHKEHTEATTAKATATDTATDTATSSSTDTTNSKATEAATPAAPVTPVTSTLTMSFARMLTDTRYTDVICHIGTPASITHAHACILASRSPPLARVLRDVTTCDEMSCHMSEGKRVLSIPHMEPRVWVHVMKCMYTDEVRTWHEHTMCAVCNHMLASCMRM